MRRGGVESGSGGRRRPGRGGWGGLGCVKATLAEGRGRTALAAERRVERRSWFWVRSREGGGWEERSRKKVPLVLVGSASLPGDPGCCLGVEEGAAEVLGEEADFWVLRGPESLRAESELVGGPEGKRATEVSLAGRGPRRSPVARMQPRSSGRAAQPAGWTRGWGPRQPRASRGQGWGRFRGTLPGPENLMARLPSAPGRF